MDDRKASEAAGETIHSEPTLTDELIQKLAASPIPEKDGVQRSDGGHRRRAEVQQSSGQTGHRDAAGGRDLVKTRRPQYYLYGFEDVSQAEAFQSGKAKLIEGGLPTAEDECVISDTLAELNGLKPGDTCQAKSIYYTDKQGRALEK